MPRLVDDAHGRIRHLLLTIPDFAIAEFGSSVQSVIGALPFSAGIDILVGETQFTVVSNWTEARPNTRIHCAPKDLDFSHWAQDALGGVQDACGVGVMLSERFDRNDDAAASKALANAAGLRLSQTSASYDGGNVLAMGDMLLVGADMTQAPDFDDGRHFITLKTETPRQPEATVPSALLPDGWREVIRSGVAENARQPLFHLDLFISPAGTGPSGQPRWLVGCPRLGAEVLGVELVDHADAVLFDEIADCLRSNGCEVVRNPQPVIWTDQLEQKLRTWFHLPVNNVLVEIARPDASVWMPCFQSEAWPELSAVDAVNKALWQSLGFQVHLVHNCLPLAERRGALRCMCNVITRDDPDGSA